MRIPFLDLSHQYHSIKPEIDAAVAAVIADHAFIGGKYTSAFEVAFAAYQQAAFCIGVGNGTDALEIALESLELQPGSEVIVPANTFIATSEAVTRSGYRIVFCDCDSSYTLSVSDAEQRITPNTRAIIPVHLYGQPCNMDAVLDLANRYKLKVIEDCAQAHGAEYNGRKVGTFGDAATFSFYPGKNLGAYGDAGAIITNNSEIAHRCRMIANHGRIAKYDHEFEGRNSRLDGLQAAVLSVKLKYLDKWTSARRDNAALYRTFLNDTTITTHAESAYGLHVYHLFVVQVNERDRLRSELASAGIETGIHYPIILPLLKAYSYLGHKPADFPAAYAASQRILSLPLYPELEKANMRFVTDMITEFTGGNVCAE